jgi:hypothetical protein
MFLLLLSSLFFPPFFTISRNKFNSTACPASSGEEDAVLFVVLAGCYA